MGLMERFVGDEEGFTTVGTAIALLLSVVLAFGAVQAHWTQTKASQVQYVADAAVLAADGAVAEFIAYAQAIDAALLSLSLVGVASYAASAVAAFIPGGEGFAAKMADFGSRVFKTRDGFAKTAKKGLNAAQKLMPALCTKRAMEVLDANSNASGVEYCGVAIPFPLTADDLEIRSDGGAEDASKDMAAREDEVAEEVKGQEEAQKKMDRAKTEAWKADCGDTVCMRERASTLANLAGSDNPGYASVDTWTFQAPLERAQRYYKMRFKAEPGERTDGSPELVGESVARKAFYKYAIEEVSKGHVATDAQGNERPDLKTLARNKETVKRTRLYTDAVYPMSSSGKKTTLHAYRGCPGYKKGEPAGFGSVSAMEGGEVFECPDCKFSVTTLWRVPSASTSIKNGFEYHYRLVVEASQRYRAAADELDKSTKKLQEAAGEMRDSLKEALGGLANSRINIQPPGRYGCVCIVYAGAVESDIAESFMGSKTTLGGRMAISAATLAPDNAVDQAEVLKNIGSGLVPQEGLVGSLAKTVFGCWGEALGAYSKGTTAVADVITRVVGSIPLVGTDLSEWVADGFEDVAASSGLAPAKVQALKPVLVGSETVLSHDDGFIASTLLSAKRGAELASEASSGDLSNVFALLDGLVMEDGETDSDGALVLAALSLGLTNLGVGEKTITIGDVGNVASQFFQYLARTRGGL